MLFYQIQAEYANATMRHEPLRWSNTDAENRAPSFLAAKTAVYQFLSSFLFSISTPLHAQSRLFHFSECPHLSIHEQPNSDNIANNIRKTWFSQNSGLVIDEVCFFLWRFLYPPAESAEIIPNGLLLIVLILDNLRNRSQRSRRATAFTFSAWNISQINGLKGSWGGIKRDAHQRKFPCPTEKIPLGKRNIFLGQENSSIFASFCIRA